MIVDVDGLGATCFAHGSPRSDEECVTGGLPTSASREFTRGIAASVFVTAHTHMQFDRRAAGLRLVNPGSVGLPYETAPAAYWAMLGPDVELRRTDYDVEGTIARMRATDDPRVEVDRRADGEPAPAGRDHRGRGAPRVRGLSAVRSTHGADRPGDLALDRFHPNIKIPVHSYYLEHEGVLIDPITPTTGPTGSRNTGRRATCC